MKTKSCLYFVSLLLVVTLSACNMPVSTPHPAVQTAQARDATQAAKAQTGNSSQTSAERDADRAAGETAEAYAVLSQTKQALEEATAQAQDVQDGNQSNPPAQQPTVVPPTQQLQPTQPPPAPPTSAPPSATSAYAELRHMETVDLDLDGSGDEMTYLADSPENPVRGHAIGQYVGGGSGAAFAPVSSVPTYETCKSIMSWNPGVLINVGNVFCYKTWQNTYGYLIIDKIEQTGDAEIPVWVVGFSYTAWK